MAVSDNFEVEGEVPPGGELVIPPTASETGGAEVFDFYGTGPVQLYRDFTVNTAYDTTVFLGTATDGDFFSTENTYIVSESKMTRLRLVNAGAEIARYQALGQEVRD